MGELSKTIGEYGENMVERFLSIIGWNDLTKGVEIKCLSTNGEHINREGKKVHTHGADFLYSYMSPLVNQELNNVIISSKYSTSKYPNSPCKKFEEFMYDLISTMECFKNSTQKQDIDRNFATYNSVNDIGVLFWLNNAEGDSADLISKISCVKIKNHGDNTIYIMDNKRVNFILSIMQFIKTRSEYKHSFYYPYTGRNMNPMATKNTGSLLPVEYINARVIPIKLENKNNSNETALFVGTIDNFEEGALMRLIGLAKDISTNLAGKVIIGFPDYHDLNHEATTTMVKQGFQEAEFTKNVSIINFINPQNAH